MAKQRRFLRLVFFGLAAFFLMLCAASISRADSVTFNSPTGNLGSTTQTYTLNGFSIVASGFNGGNLYGKNAGASEQGLGLAGDPSGQHEIFAIAGAPQDYIQLNLLSLITAGFTNFEFGMNSTDGRRDMAGHCMRNSRYSRIRSMRCKRVYPNRDH